MEQVRSARRRRWADASPSAPAGQWSMGDRWPLLVSVLADEQADLLRALREHLADAPGSRPLPGLHEAADRLQRTSRHAQQIARLASGRVRQFRERVDLRQLLRTVLADLDIPTGPGRAIAELDLAPAEACMDASAAYTVVECLLAWLQVHGSAMVLATQPGRGSAGPVLAASGHRSRLPAPAGRGSARRRLDDGLELLLLQQAVWANGLTLRILAGTDITVRVGFPPAAPDVDALGWIELPAPQSGDRP